MTETVQGESSAAATMVAPEVPADAGTTDQPGAESAPAKVEPLDPDFSSDIENVQKKFNNLTEKRRSEERARRRAEEERDYWRQEAIRRQSQPEPEKPAVVEVADEVKTLASFDYDETKFNAYILEKAAKHATAQAKRELEANREREEQGRRAQTFKQREAEFEKSVPDYREVAYYAPISDEIAHALMRLEDGPQLAYHLGKNKDVAERLRDLPLEVAAFELGAIHARLKAERDKKPPVVSKAPAPPPKIESAGDTPIEKNPADWSDKEFEKWRRKYQK